MRAANDPQEREGIEDHLRRQREAILLLLDRLDQAGGQEARLVLGELHREVQMQFIVEDAVVHPACREHVPGLQAEVLVAEGRVGHDLVDRRFAALYGMDPSDPEFARNAAALRRSLERHVEWQREDVLPALAASCPASVLAVLGRRARAKCRDLRASRRLADSPAAF